MTDHPEIRQVAALAQEVAALRDALRVQSDLALERLARAERYRSRLARVLWLVEGTALRVYWTDHNGGGSVWRVHGFPTNFPRSRGCVWSRRALDKKGE